MKTHVSFSDRFVLRSFKENDSLTLTKEDSNFYHILIPELGCCIMHSDDMKERDDYYKRLVIYLTENMI